MQDRLKLSWMLAASFVCGFALIGFVGISLRLRYQWLHTRPKIIENFPTGLSFQAITIFNELKNRNSSIPNSF